MASPTPNEIDRPETIAVTFITTTATFAWATFTYLVAYRFVIGLAPAVSILAQAVWLSKPRGAPRRLHFLFGLLSGAATSPTARGVRGALAAAADTGPVGIVAAVSGAHFLTAYTLLLLGPVLGKDVLLSLVVGAIFLTAIAALAWRPGPLTAAAHGALSSSEIGHIAVRELLEVGPQIALGLLAGGAVAAWGLSPLRIELATVLGGGLPAQVGSALVGTALGSLSCLPPVASLFVATYLWKTGIAHAGLVSFLLASATTLVRLRLYRRELGEREGARLWWILLLSGPVAGLATAVVFRLLGLTIHYRLVSEQLL